MTDPNGTRMTGLYAAPEVFTTLGLREGMRVTDATVAHAPAHIVGTVTTYSGCCDVAWTDCREHSVVGLRHPWRLDPAGGTA